MEQSKSGLTYKNDFGPGPVTVLLDGRVVGAIHRVDGGFSYVPKGRSKVVGDVFSTLTACKQSLEAA